jgi:predicted CoA-binding protein
VTDADLAAILRVARTIAVVGLSPHAHRPSHGVARYLQRAGYRVVPVNPGHATILGERSYASLGLAAADHAIDVVDVFRRSEFAGAVVDQALPLAPRLIFLQLGVTDVAAGERARAAGVPFIQDRCLAVEHQRLVA